ncbi:MAG TPA: hypothetical protein VLM40_22570 [Gemmata sp.]|nr:hypothetical protein [Gemmata sp.]
MRIRTFVAFPGLALLIALSCRVLPAQEPKVDLPKDVVPSTFRMFVVTDNRFEPLKDDEGKPLVGPDGKSVPNPKNRTGKIHCLVCEYGLNPTVAMFVRPDVAALGGADGGVGKLIKQVNALIPKYRADKLGAFAAFLRLDFDGKPGTKIVTVKVKQANGTEIEQKVEEYKEYPDEDDQKRDKYAESIRNFEKDLSVPNVPFGLAPEKSKTISEWKIADTDEVTVILYHRMRIIGQPWRFAKAADVTDAKIAEIIKATEAEITGKH